MDWGAISEIYVPYKDGNLWLEPLSQAVEFLNSKGVDGFFVNGVGAEALPLSLDEKKRVLEKVLERSKNKIIIQNITEYKLEKVLELAKHAKDSGASHLLISQHPVYSLSNYLLFYKKVSEKVELPIILYNEKLLGQIFSPAQVSAILSLDNFVGYKDSTRDISHTQEVLELMPKGKDLIAGSDSMIYVTYALGGKGIVSLVINPFPELVVDIVKQLKDKNYNKAFESQLKINRVREILKSYGFSAGYREACRIREIECGEPYNKLEALNEKQKDELRQKLTLEGLI